MLSKIVKKIDAFVLAQNRWVVTLVAVLIGIVFIMALATLHVSVILGSPITPKIYIMPILVGGGFGLILSNMYYILRAQARELQQARDELEQRVAARTAELTAEIADRRKAQEQYRRIQERYALAAEAGRTSVWEYDMQTKRFATDDVTRVLFGHKYNQRYESIVTWVAPIHPDDKQAVIDALNVCIDGWRETYEVVYRLMSDDGQILWLEDHGLVLRDETNQPTRLVASTTDITSRKRAEVALQESEARLNEAQRLAKLGSWRRNFETGEGYWSDAYYQLFGYQPHEVTQSNELFQKHIHPDDAPRVMQAISQAYKAGTPFNEAFRFIRKDGSVRYGHSVGIVEQDADRDQKWIFGTLQDITDLKQTEEKLRESEQLLQQFQNIAKIGGWDIDLRTMETHWTEYVYKIHGLPLEQKPPPIEGAIEFYHPDSRPIITEAVNQLIEAGTPFDLDLKFITAQQKHIWVRAIGSPVYEQEQIVGIRGTFTDITSRKQAQRALEASEAQLNEAQRIAMIGSLQRDLNIGKGQWSDAFYELLGYQPGEVTATDKLFFSHIHPEDRAQIFDGLKEVDADGKLPDQEFRFYRKDGTMRHAHIRGRISRNGSEQLLLGTLQDITERKQMEEKLAESNSNLERFAYIISHDLKEPLRMVTSYLSLLERRYEDQLDERASKYIFYAVDGATRMDQLIDGLLAYSRLHSDGFNLAPTDGREILQNVLRDLQVAVEEKGAVITYDEMPTLTADAARLEQVFQNLISNALKFCDQDAPQVHIGAQQQSGTWILSVKDNGIGIDPKQQSRIFEIFKRLNKPGEYEGTGIGLAVCKKIIEEHGGHIWVESETGHGATFYVSIPADQEATATPPTPKALATVP